MASNYDELKDAREVDKYLYDGNKDLMEKTQQCFRYTTHDQWDEVDKQKLISEHRPVLEIDLISPKQNTLVGIEHDFRSGSEALPFEGGDKKQAAIATFVLKHLDLNERMSRMYSRVFKSIVTCGIGVIDNHIRQGDDYMAEVDPRRDSPFRVEIDPQGLEPDQSDWVYMKRNRWMTDDQIKSIWPEADIVKLRAGMGEDEIIKAIVSDDLDYFEGSGISWSYYIDPKRAKRRVAEIYERKFSIKDFIFQYDTGRVFTLAQFLKNPITANMLNYARVRNQTNYQPKDEKELVEILQGSQVNGHAIIKRQAKEIHMSIFTASAMLEKQKKLPYNHNDFPIIMAFGYLGEQNDGRMRTSGIVEGLMGVQDEKNKRRSQALDILNRAPKAAGFFQLNKGVTKEDLESMQISGEWVGVRGKISDFIQERDQKFVPILTNIASLEQQAEIDATNIGGVNLPMQGVASGSKESGIAAQTRIRHGMMGVTELLDNLDIAKIRTIKQDFSYIQQYYPVSKIRRIIGSEDLEVSDEAITQFLNTYQSTKYDFGINEESSPTARRWQLANAMAMLQYGIPPALIIEDLIRLSDSPNADKILQEVKIQKSLMAQSGTSQLEPGGGQGTPA
ncbi:MAG: hypothetical protein CEE38_23595 [Planctomycetes bacterium B3_Pla]|nr:MAG: hypothetical protein CEE38_23595 [Planctomycetes bacterium B3_Pla]